MSLFIVRWAETGYDPDFKVFRRRADAAARFRKGRRHVFRNFLESAAMFEASGDNVRGAVQAVKDGKARLIETDGKKDVDEAIGEFVRSGVVIESVRKFVWGISAELVAYKHEESQIGL